MSYTPPPGDAITGKWSPPNIIPFSGNALKSSGGPIDFVLIFNWSNGELIDYLQPEGNGDWSTMVLVGEIGITYFVEGCKPDTYGPILIEPE